MKFTERPELIPPKKTNKTDRLFAVWEAGWNTSSVHRKPQKTQLYILSFGKLHLEELKAITLIELLSLCLEEKHRILCIDEMSLLLICKVQKASVTQAFTHFF